jgi:Zn-dependent protease
MRTKLVLYLVVVASVVLHELGHALSALAFGDDTAKNEGHITLNPWKVSPFGAVILPGMLVLLGGYPIAFASTPVTPRKMRNPRLHSLLCSLAGPAVNIVLLLVSLVALRGAGQYLFQALDSWPLPVLIAYEAGKVNVLLAVFNLIPIPPLDGSALVERILPRHWWPGWIKFRQYGMGILLLLVLGAPQLFSRILVPALNLWSRQWAHTNLF